MDSNASIESIHGQHIPRMKLLKINYVQPNLSEEYRRCNHLKQKPSKSKHPQTISIDEIFPPRMSGSAAYKKFNEDAKKGLFVTSLNNDDIKLNNCEHSWKVLEENYMKRKRCTPKRITSSPISRSAYDKIGKSETNVRHSRVHEIENCLLENEVLPSSNACDLTKISSDICKISKMFEQTKLHQNSKDIQTTSESNDRKYIRLPYNSQFKCCCRDNTKSTTMQRLHLNDNESCDSSEQGSRSADRLYSSSNPIEMRIEELLDGTSTIDNDALLEKIKCKHRHRRHHTPDSKNSKRSNLMPNRCQMDRIHLKKTLARRQPLLIINEMERDIGLCSQVNTTISNNELERKNEKTCGYKNCQLTNCPMLSASNRLGCTNDRNNKHETNTEQSDKNENKAVTDKTKEVKVIRTDLISELDGTEVSSQPDLNDVQNFSGKSLIKATTDEMMLSSALNNTVCRNLKNKTEIDVNLKNNENRKFNDLKAGSNPQHILKIFVKNSSASNQSLNSDSHSSASSDRDDGSYDKIAESRSVTDDAFKGNKLPANNFLSTFPAELGCDGSIFLNNYCFFDDLDSKRCCSVKEEKKDIPGGQCDYLCLCSRKTDMHDIRPKSMEAGLDSGVSISGDTGSSPDSDISSQHLQSQQDLEARRLKRGHVLTELLETERIYVSEMNSILKGYRDPMLSEEMIHLVPPGLQGKEDILFGNLHELYTFHSEVFLKDLENCISTTELVALCFVQRRDTFYKLYSFYCQNIPRSERLRETLVDTHLFLQECQKRLGHKLPLAAYLLKPVQRITKYQLLLKDLLRFSDSGTCTRELQKALDCMLIVLKCVNDSMHQVAITGFPADLSQQGELLLQDSFQVWTESKKDIRLRLKTQHRHIFLYQKAMLFCKQTSKTGHNKSTYQFKHYLKMSQIGLTESVRGDPKRFEVWLQGRQEVHTLQAPTIEIKNKWVAEIKRVLLNQLEELKGEKIKQYGLNHRPLRQTVSWDTPNSALSTPQRALSCDTNETNRSSNGHEECIQQNPGVYPSSSEKDNQDGSGWSSDYSNSEDELSIIEDNSTPTLMNFLAQWAVESSCTRTAKSNSTFYVSVE